MKKFNLYNFFYIFILGSIFGWIVEGIYTLMKKGILINHSALVIGPFNVVYGIGACVLSILLYKCKDSNMFKIFLISLVGGTLLEYLMSLGMEYIVGFTAWDYSQKFLNINGRVALFYSICWGLLGVIWIKLCYPFVMKVIGKMKYSIGKKLMIGLIIFLLLDLGLTLSAVNRAKEKELGVEATNRYERFLDSTFNKNYLKNMFNNRWK